VTAVRNLRLSRLFNPTASVGHRQSGCTGGYASVVTVRPPARAAGPRRAPGISGSRPRPPRRSRPPRTGMRYG